MAIDRKLRQRDTTDPGQAIENPKEADKASKEEVPNVLFAPDGRTFFPCKYCCRAFAHKRSLTTHLRVCSFKVVEVSDSEDEENGTKGSVKKLKGVKTETVKKVDATEAVSSKITVPKKNGINILGNVVIKAKTVAAEPSKTENWVEVKDFVANDIKNVTAENMVESVKNLTETDDFKVKTDAQETPKVEDDTASRQRRIRMDQKPAKTVKKESATAKKRSTNGNAKKTAAKRPKMEPTKAVNDTTEISEETTVSTKNSRKVEVFKKIACLICAEHFENSIDLFRHKREMHSYKKKVKLSPESLKIYDKVFQKSPKKICPLCKKPSTKVGWKRHLQTHSSEVKYFCSICKKGFNRIDHQREHEKRHVVQV